MIDDKTPPSESARERAQRYLKSEWHYTYEDATILAREFDQHRAPLEASVEHWRSEFGKAHRLVAEMGAENDRLRASLEKHVAARQDACAEYDRLHAELEQERERYRELAYAMSVETPPSESARERAQRWWDWFWDGHSEAITDVHALDELAAEFDQHATVGESLKRQLSAMADECDAKARSGAWALGMIGLVVTYGVLANGVWEWHGAGPDGLDPPKTREWRDGFSAFEVLRAALNPVRR